MDIVNATELIASLGFPIATAVAMAFFIYKLYMQSVERENKLYTEIEESRKINASAIETLAAYAESLERIESDIAQIKTDVITLVTKEH